MRAWLTFKTNLTFSANDLTLKTGAVGGTWHGGKVRLIKLDAVNIADSSNTLGSMLSYSARVHSTNSMAKAVEEAFIHLECPPERGLGGGEDLY